MSDRQRPDYRNSIKESISAVESIAQQLSGNNKATLDDALKILEKKGKLHQRFCRQRDTLVPLCSKDGGVADRVRRLRDLHVQNATAHDITNISDVPQLVARHDRWVSVIRAQGDSYLHESDANHISMLSAGSLLYTQCFRVKRDRLPERVRFGGDAWGSIRTSALSQPLGIRPRGRAAPPQKYVPQPCDGPR